MQYAKHVISAVLVTVACLSFEEDAHAYLDPGTGSMVFQALAAVVVGGLAAVKIYWHRIKNLLPGNRTAREESPDRDERQA